MTVNIDPAILEKIEALPDAQSGPRGHQWTPEEDAIILKYWGKKRQVDIARILGLTQNPCRARYRELIDREVESRR